MRKRRGLALCLACGLGLAACAGAPPPAKGEPAPGEGAGEPVRITLSFQGHTYPAVLADNSSARAFADLLGRQGGALTVKAHDYGGFEKVGELPEELPRNDTPTDTTAGDLILYQGTSIVLYYAPNRWEFTPLGRLEGDLSQLQAHLGQGDVEIVYTLAQ